MKKIALLLFILVTQIQAQSVVKGTITSEDNLPTWLILYQLKGAEQKYILNETITNGNFEFTIPSEAEKGVYRITYGTTATSFVDFLFLGEEVTLQFNYNKPNETLNFKKSADNQLYVDYVKKINTLQQKIDSVQLNYFNLKEDEDKLFSKKLYENAIKKYVEIQKEFEEKSKDHFTKSLIKQSQKYNSSTIFKSPQLYLNSERKHFFDFVNINSDAFLKSNLLSEKVIGYVFYLNQSDDVQMQNLLYKQAVDVVIEKIKENVVINAEVQLLLLNLFTQLENVVLVDYVIETYYNKLPEAFQNKEYINKISNKLSVAIGRKAPNFTWTNDGNENSLYNFNTTDKTLLVFWSTGCSHCLVEIPQLHDFYKKDDNFKILAIALENNNEGFKELKKTLPKFNHIYGANKWENSIAKKYQITSTPTYFVLDSNKNIIAKPYTLEDVKAYFSN